MKTPLLLLLSLCAACIGYAVGTLWSEESHDLPGPPPSGHRVSGEIPRIDDGRMSEAAAKTLAALRTPKRLEDFVAAFELLSCLTPADFPKVMAVITGMPANIRNEWMMPFFQAWIRCDAAGARAWGAEITGRIASSLNVPYDDPMRLIAREWCRAFPDAALGFVRNRWPKAGAGDVLRRLILDWPKDDRTGCLAKIESLPAGKLRQRSVTSFFREWASEDSERALSAARAIGPGSERESALSQVIVSGAQLNPVRAFALARESGIDSQLFLQALGKEAGVSKGAATVKWLAESAPELISVVGPPLASQWARTDPAAALSWAMANGLSLMDRISDPLWRQSGTVDWQGMTSSNRGWDPPLSEGMIQKPKETIEWLRALPHGEQRDGLIQRAMHSTRDGAEVLALFSELPSERQASGVWPVVSASFGGQPEKARAWAGGLPAGQAQDTAWQIIARSFGVPAELPASRMRDIMAEAVASQGNLAPDAGLATVAMISDPALRRSAFENFMWGALHESTPEKAAAAREAMEKADVPEEWKRAFGATSNAQRPTPNAQ